MMIIQTDNGEERTLNIEGGDYWTVPSFSRLVQKTDRVIRLLASKGNRIRKLKHKSIYGRVYIEENEVFDYPFTMIGRVSELGNTIEKFSLVDGRLIKEELNDKKCQI